MQTKDDGNDDDDDDDHHHNNHHDHDDVDDPTQEGNSLSLMWDWDDADRIFAADVDDATTGNDDDIDGDDDHDDGRL